MTIRNLLIPFLSLIIFSFIFLTQKKGPKIELTSTLKATFTMPANVDTLQYHRAEFLKWNHDFAGAARLYAKMLRNEEDLREEDRKHIRYQLYYCRLENGQDTTELRQFFMNRPEVLSSPENINCEAVDYFYYKALYLYKREAFFESENLLRRVVDCYRYCLGEDNLKTMQGFNALGLAIYAHQHQLDSANYYVNQAYDLIEKQDSPPPYLAEIYYGKAFMAKFFRDYNTGIFCVRQAIYALSKSLKPRRQLLLSCYDLLSELLKLANEVAAADTIIQRNIRLAKKWHVTPVVLAGLYQKAFFLQLKLEDSLSAKRYIGLIQKMTKQPLELGIDFDRLWGKYHFTFGQHLQSVQCYQRFLSRPEGAVAKNPLDIKEAYWNMGQSYQLLHDFSKARKAIYQLIAFQAGMQRPLESWSDIIDEQIRTSVHISPSYNRLASILISEFTANSNKEESLERAFQLYQIIDAIKSKEVDAFNEAAFLHAARTYHIDIYANAIRAAFLMYQLRPHRKYLTWANHFIERLKSPIMYRDMLHKRAKHYEGLPDSLVVQERAAKVTIDSLITHFNRLNPQQNTQALHALATIEQVYARYQQDFPEYFAAKRQSNAIDLRDVQGFLSEQQESILQLHVGEDRINVLLIQADTISFQELNLSSELGKDIQQYKELLRKPKIDFNSQDIEEYNSLTYQIYSTLFRPFEALLARAPNLTIIPHGFLQGIPFEALTTTLQPKPKDASYGALAFLIDRFTISYAFSLKSYFQNTLNQDDFSSLKKGVAFSFSRPPVNERQIIPKSADTLTRGKLSELKNAIEEVQTIANYFPETQLFMGNEANEATFRKVADSEVDFLHLAVHAQSDEFNASNNALFFKSVDLMYDTLWMYELVGMKLQIKLVVLSSCETGSGEEKIGEGVYSLARAFMISGVERLITSLWQINDKSTAQLMGHFYSALPNQSACAALRWAKMEYIRKAPAHRSHPALWAGLVYFGG